MVAVSPSPDGPWTKLGTVNRPTGRAPDWGPAWNARRLDSGRALVIGGKKGYWTKGVSGASPTAVASEGLYVPDRPASWAPPWSEWRHNPLFGPTAADPAGYENCEFFMGPAEVEPHL